MLFHFYKMNKKLHYFIQYIHFKNKSNSSIISSPWIITLL